MNNSVLVIGGAIALVTAVATTQKDEPIVIPREVLNQQVSPIVEKLLNDCAKEGVAAPDCSNREEMMKALSDLDARFFSAAQADN